MILLKLKSQNAIISQFQSKDVISEYPKTTSKEGGNDSKKKSEYNGNLYYSSNFQSLESVNSKYMAKILLDAV